KRAPLKVGVRYPVFPRRKHQDEQGIFDSAIKFSTMRFDRTEILGEVKIQHWVCALPWFSFYRGRVLDHEPCKLGKPARIESPEWRCPPESRGVYEVLKII